MVDYIDVANVISRYAAANIPMETMWTDIGICSDFLHTRCVLNFNRLHGSSKDFHS